MAQYIKKSDLVAEIKRRIKTEKECMLGLRNLDYYQGKVDALNDIISFVDALEVKEVNLELENENNNPRITVGIKLRLKMNPDVILSIISDDCHEDKFECSNGSVLSLKQIEKYYDLV